MGPDLWELYEDGKADDEIAAIIRLGHYAVLPKGVRVVTQFSEIITVRLRRSDIPNVSGAPEVNSMIAGDTVHGPDLELESAELSSDTVLATDERRPPDEKATGRGVIVGAIDWGFDFAHPDFRHPDGTTRILALWDQRGGKRPDSPAPFGYGVVHDRNAINRALKENDPYAALHYHPADADTGIGCHGTHVVSIAAGTGGDNRPVGIAPEADLVLVHNAPWNDEESGKLGDSVTLLEGIDFIARTAGDRPWVINTSLGRHGEQHDGTTLIEQGFDAAVRASAGRAICMSAGNYFNKRIHASGQLRPTQERTFVWEINQGSRPSDNNQLEVWYSWQDKFEASVHSPDGSIAASVKIGERAKLLVGGKEVGNAYHRGQEPNSLDNHIVVFLYKEAPAGPWEVRLRGSDVIDGRFHAWIEREVACPKCQSRFRAEDADPKFTTGTICNGKRTIAVGAFDNHDPETRMGPFSSVGPTRDGRLKPDLCAPGVSVLAARSHPREKDANVPLLTRMSGTSMAAPHVTGTVALMFQAAPRGLRIEETHNLLLENTRRVSVPEEIPDRIGIGFLDVSAAVQAARKVAIGTTTFKQSVHAASPAQPKSEAREAERYGKIFGGEAERVTRAEAATGTGTTIRGIGEAEMEAVHPVPRAESVPSRMDFSERHTRQSEAVEMELSDAEAMQANAIVRQLGEDLIPAGGDCSAFPTDCLFPPASDIGKIRPKGKPEGAYIDRTEGDRSVNLALQLFDYDINAYLPVKPKHAEALGKIREFIVDRSVRTTEDIGVTITGLASHTGGKDYNYALSCKRAICAADNLRRSIDTFRGVLERTKINASGDGFEHATCKGSDCELGEWRSVLIQVHAPNRPPRPIPPVDPGWDKYSIRCNSFHTQGVSEALLGDLIKKVLPNVPDGLKSGVLKALRAGLQKLVSLLLKELPKFESVVQGLSEFLELLPAEVIRENGVFEITERDKENARGVVLSYSGWGLRILLPRQNLDDFLDDALGKVSTFQGLPDFVKKQIKNAIKNVLPSVLKTLIQPIESTTPGPFVRIDLKEKRSLRVFEGTVQIGEGFWMPGQVNVEFDSSPWRLPDPAQRPAIVACPGGECNAAGVQIRVGSGQGLELLAITAGDLTVGSGATAGAGTPKETESMERAPAELVEMADQIVTQGNGLRPPESVLHEMLARTGSGETLALPGLERLPSASEIFDAFVYTGLAPIRISLDQRFEVVAGPLCSLDRDLRHGDVLIRRCDGDTGHVSVIVSPELRTLDTLISDGLKPEAYTPGHYVQVVETGWRPHSLNDNFARCIADPNGVLPRDTLVLRFKSPLAAGQAVEGESMADREPRRAGSNGPAVHGAEAGDSERFGGVGRVLDDLLLFKLVTQPPPPPPAPTVIKVDGAAPPELLESESVSEDELSCDHIDASQLSWPGASAAALDLMRRVYLRQTQASCQVRTFVGDVPQSELAQVEGSVYMRGEAAGSCRNLLAAARAAMASDSSATFVRSIGVISGYRSASTQLSTWNHNFPRYYQETQADRSALSGGEFGEAATALLTRYISVRLAAPGFSLHNDGRAIDFSTVDSGHSLGADTHAASRNAWRRSWFFGWLTANANGYGFFQNTSIDEPWHWEFRGLPAATQSEALFFPVPDTVEPVFSRHDSELRPESEDASIAAGRLELSRTPLLASHRGTQPDLILRWNDMPAGSPVDVVVHLHGYSSDKLAMKLRNKELYSGLDFSNPNGSGSIGRTASTLCIIPRGSYVGDQPKTNPEAYTFPALVGRDGIRNLISYGVAQFANQAGSGATPSGRTILTAHSGGGYPLMPILAFNTPDEIHIFDALYWDASNLIAWLRNRIAAEIQAWTPGQLRAAGGLCVIYRPSGTKKQSLLVLDAIRSSIDRAPGEMQLALRASYRVLSTAVAHGEIPKRFGWRLLTDITADLSDGASAPSAEAILPGPRISSIPSEDFGDGSKFVSKAVAQCWSDLQSLTKTLSRDDNPARASLLQIKSETGVAVDKNPYYGLTQAHLEAVIRAAFNSTQAPETLLALWAKEGSLKMETGSVQVSQASTAANARSIFRCIRFYVDLGSDTFLVTHYDPARKDNVWDDSDDAAAGHEARFLDQVKALVDGGFLGQDISAAVNAELTVSSASSFTVTASTEILRSVSASDGCVIHALPAEHFFTAVLD